MLEKYPFPSEMPKVFIDNDGVVNVIFGTIIITPAHIIHGAAIQKQTFPDQKLPVMIVGEIAKNIKGEIAQIGSSESVASVTERLAIVTERKITQVLGKLFIEAQENPYETKLFSTQKEAKMWLTSTS